MFLLEVTPDLLFKLYKLPLLMMGESPSLGLDLILPGELLSMFLGESMPF